MPIYQDINEVVVDQCQPNDEPTDLSDPSSDLPSYVRNDTFIRPGRLSKKCKNCMYDSLILLINLNTCTSILFTIISKICGGPIFMDFVGSLSKKKQHSQQMKCMQYYW